MTREFSLQSRNEIWTIERRAPLVYPDTKMHVDREVGMTDD
jgi:hypothetical protein